MADTISLYNNSFPDMDNSSIPTKIFPLEENYIYFYHTDTLILLPCWPDNIGDGQSASWSPTTILGRSAPIQSYGSTGSRSLNIQLKFHREILKQTNFRSRYNLQAKGVNEDYVDQAVNMLYGSVIPNYSSSAKLVDPPMVAARFGNQTYIKGVVTTFSAGYSGAILRDGKYSMIEMTIGITEINPYDAITAMGVGAFRSDGDILMSTELNKSTYNIGQGDRANRGKIGGGFPNHLN